MAKSYKVTVFAGAKVVADMAQQVKNATIEASIQLKTIKGGLTSANATVLAPGPNGANRKMEDVEGWFVNGTAANPPVATGTAWEAPAGKKNVNWWDGATGKWSLGSSLPLPEAQAVDTFDPNGSKPQSQKGVANAISKVSLTKEEVGITSIPIDTEWAQELKDSSMTDTSIWHQNRTYIPTTGQLSAPTAPQEGFIASVKKYPIPKGDFDFETVLQLISGTAGLCLYDEKENFIKTVVSHRDAIAFKSANARYFTVTHRIILSVTGISVKNKQVINDDKDVIYAKKADAASKTELNSLSSSLSESLAEINEISVKKADVGISAILAGTEWAEELRNSNPDDLSIWYQDRIYIPSTGILSAQGNTSYVGYKASVKKYEIKQGNYDFTAVMQVVSGTTGLCLYDENGSFIKTVVSLGVPVVFNTQNAKYFTVTYRASKKVSDISVKNNTNIETLENPLFIPSSRENEFLKKGDIATGTVFNRFSEVELGESFPASCSVGNFDLVRNTNTKTGNVYYDYNIKGQTFPKIRRASILNKVEIARSICDVDKNGDLFSVSGKSILRSTDLGVTWTTLATVPLSNGFYWVFCLGNGELMMLDGTKRGATIDADAIGGVYVSSANRTVFTKVHTFRNRYQYIVPSWGVELVGSDIYFSEYGNSYPDDTTNDPSWNRGTKADATRIWKSADYGQTFSQLVDLNTLTELYPANGNLHIHGIHYDRYWNRLWLTSGDGGGAIRSNKKLAWTDNGMDWGAIDLSKYYNGGGSGGTPYENLQGLSMYSTNDVLLIGADCWNNAVFRVNKRNKNEIYLEDGYKSSPLIIDDITYFTGRFSQYIDSPIFIPFGAGDSQTDAGKNSRHPKIVATWNGIEFVEIWSDMESPTGCEQTDFRLWKIRGKYYIHIKYPSILKQYLIEVNF